MTLDNRELGSPLDAHRFDEAALGSYLVRHMEGFSGECTVRQFRGGQSNPTFLVEAESGAYVLRKKPPGRLLPSAHAVDREYRVIAALKDTPVPVPRAYLLCEDESVIGQMFYVMDYVPGRVFTDRDMQGCSAAERTAMYGSLVRVLGALHATDYRDVGLADFGKPNAYVARQVARWSKQYEASKIEECPAMDNVIAWLGANDPGDETAAIVHGDFRPGNVIFANDQPEVAAVLDWELSTIGHPLADLGYFLMAHRLDASVFPYGIGGMDLDGLGIPSEPALVEAYAAAAGRSELPDIDFYVIFSMFRLAAILAGVLRRGLDGNASDPRAIEQGRSYKQFAEAAWAIAEPASQS